MANNEDKKDDSNLHALQFQVGENGLLPMLERITDQETYDVYHEAITELSKKGETNLSDEEINWIKNIAPLLEEFEGEL